MTTLPLLTRSWLPTPAYPDDAAARDRFVLDRRPEQARPHDLWHPQAVLVEDEPTSQGTVAPMATVFLTTRECPWRCTMCDLWQHAATTRTPGGAVPAQIASAREQLRARPVAVSRLKLYNAGSFFDVGAVPESDYGAIARHLRGLAHVVVESHPALVGPRVDRLMDAVRREARTQEPPTLEVAMGLETANPSALARLNKRMTVDAFARAAEVLTKRSVDVRAFVLIGAPFIAPEEQDAWLLRSVEAAFAAGASIVSMVPTRGGNGALDTLGASALFTEPSLADIERSATLALGIFGSRGRVLVDLWDLKRFARCPHCFESRRTRLHAMNLSQTVTQAPLACGQCRREP